VVKGHKTRPGKRNIERFDNVRVLAVDVVRGVIAPLGEHLTLEGIPVSFQERFTQGFGLLLQLEDVVVGDERVLGGKRRDVLRRDDLLFVRGF